MVRHVKADARRVPAQVQVKDAGDLIRRRLLRQAGEAQMRAEKEAARKGKSAAPKVNVD